MAKDIRRELLGSILKWPTGVKDIEPLLSWDDPLSSELSIVLPIISKMYEDKKVVGISSVLREMQAINKDINIPNMEIQLGECMDIKCTSIMLPAYVDEIIASLVSGNIRDLVMEVGSTINKDHSNPELLIDRVESCLQTIRSSMACDEEITIDSSCDEGMSEFDSYVKDGVSPIMTTGLCGLDRIINGFTGGQYILISALSGVGKSALATSMMIQQAQVGIKCAFISLEMDSKALTKRLVQQVSGFDQDKYCNTNSYTDYNTGDTVSGDHEKARSYLREAHSKLKKYGIRKANPSNMSIASIKGICRQMVNDGIEIIYIDYVQLIKGNKRLNREQEVADVSSQLRALAIELNIPLIVLAQMGPKANEYGPSSEFVRESKQPKFDCFVAILIDNDTKGQRRDKIIIDKNRNGGVGEFDIEFNPNFVSFVSDADTGTEEI